MFDIQIGVGIEIWMNIVPKCIQKNLFAFTTSKFQCRDKVGIAGHQYDNVYMLFQCQCCNIQSDTKICPLLLDFGF